MLDMEMFEESHSDWNSPIMLVPKHDGEVQFCMDFHRLNVNVVFKFDAYPMHQCIDKILARLIK